MSRAEDWEEFRAAVHLTWEIFQQQSFAPYRGAELSEVELTSSQSDAQSGHYSIHELERIRDDNLVAILQALKMNKWRAGEALAHYEKRRFGAEI